MVAGWPRPTHAPRDTGRQVCASLVPGAQAKARQARSVSSLLAPSQSRVGGIAPRCLVMRRHVVSALRKRCADCRKGRPTASVTEGLDRAGDGRSEVTAKAARPASQRAIRFFAQLINRVNQR